MIPLGVLASGYVAPAGGGWSPLDIGAALRSWHDASVASSLTVDGLGNVTGWSDLSGNGFTYTGTAGVFADGAINAKTALRHTGKATLADSGTVVRDPSPQHYHFVLVCYAPAISQYHLAPLSWIRDAGIAIQDGTGASFSDTSKSPGQTNRVNGVSVPSVSGDLWTATQNGPFVATIQYVVTDTTGLYFESGMGADLLIGERIILKTNTPDAGIIASAEAYLMTKWGIS